MTQEDPEDRFTSQSVGDRLRQAREEAGLSLDQVAAQTRIPMRHLQHIEREEWDALPAVTYCVGFVRSYANAIGLDGAELSREVRDRLGGLRTPVPAAEYYEPADPARVPPRALAIAAALIAALLVAGYLIWRGTLGQEAAPPRSVTVPVEDAEAPAPAPKMPSATQVMTGQPVVLTATQEVWLRITDAAGGPSLFNGTMTPGQTFEVPSSAQNPVIRTGRPQVLRVSIGGRDIGPLEPSERTISDVSLRAEDVAARIQGATTAAQSPTS
jgi:cytoskeleton protein RodZ